MYYIVVSWVAMRKILYDIDILMQYFYNLEFLWGAHAFISEWCRLSGDEPFICAMCQ
jgi:hypothetical protein